MATMLLNCILEKLCRLWDETIELSRLRHLDAVGTERGLQWKQNAFRSLVTVQRV